VSPQWEQVVEEIPTPTPRELEILKVLWELGPCTVRAVHEHSFKVEDIAFNTVQTMLRLMADKKKGLVTAQLSGRTFVYTARFSRDQMAIRFLDRVFDGASAEMVQSLIRSERVSSDELEQMQAMIDKARRGRLRHLSEKGGRS
jgi:BlaI family transcriptional regulator, penicillinase repressor